MRGHHFEASAIFLQVSRTRLAALPLAFDEPFDDPKAYHCAAMNDSSRLSLAMSSGGSPARKTGMFASRRAMRPLQSAPPTYKVAFPYNASATAVAGVVLSPWRGHGSSSTRPAGAAGV